MLFSNWCDRTRQRLLRFRPTIQSTATEIETLHSQHDKLTLHHELKPVVTDSLEPTSLEPEPIQSGFRPRLLIRLRNSLFWLDKCTGMIGLLVSPLTLIMMVMTCLVVIARYVFNIGATPVQEATMYLHGMVFMLGISYTLQQAGHVRVDIIYNKFSASGQALVNLFGSLFLLMPTAGFIFWSSIDYVGLSWSFKESSPAPGGLPFVYLLKTLIPLMAVLLFYQGIVELLRNLLILLETPAAKANLGTDHG